MITYVTNIIDELKKLDQKSKTIVFSVGLTMFFLLFSYPILRTTTQALFLDAFKAKSSPYVWLYSVIVLSITVTFFSWLQKNYSVQRIFTGASIFSIIFFVGGTFLFDHHSNYWAYPLFIWKEVYIVILIHMVLAYLNASIDVETAKIVYGPMGALGSFGGMIGGLIASYLTGYFTVSWIQIIGGALITFTCFSFAITAKFGETVLQEERKPKASPLGSLKGVEKYVALIVGLVILSQFSMGLASFKFNVLLEQFHETKASKAEFLGKLYSSMNFLSMFIQVALVPIVLKKISLLNVHRFIPICYLIAVGLGFGLGGHLLLPVAAAFVLFKGMDYSIFSAAKAILYFPLTETQRYGAKYICDMIFYRLGKGLISIILIFFQSSYAINIMIVSFLSLWLISLGPMFKIRHRLLKTEEA